MSSPRNRRQTGGGSFILDKLLVPRIENYALNSDINDPDSVVDYLRTTYKEYQRRQIAAMRLLVIRALEVIQCKGGVKKPEIRLQNMEAKHLARKHKKEEDMSSSDSDSDDDNEASNDASETVKGQKRSKGNASGSAERRFKKQRISKSSDEDSSSSDGNSSSVTGRDSDSESDSGSSSGDDLDGSSAASLAGGILSSSVPQNHAKTLNNSLLSMYARNCVAESDLQSKASTEGSNAQEVAEKNQVESEAVVGSTRKKAAFSSLADVKAAALRALALEKVEARKTNGNKNARKRTVSDSGGIVPTDSSASADKQLLPQATNVASAAVAAATASTTAAPVAGVVCGTASPSFSARSTCLFLSQPTQTKEEDSTATATTTITPVAEPAATALPASVALPATPQGASAGKAGSASAASGRAQGRNRDKQASGGGKRQGSGGSADKYNQGGFQAGLDAAAGRGGVGSSICQPRPITYSELGGIEEVLSDIRELVEFPLSYPEVYRELGVAPPRGVLLHGPPGCGKTALANAIAYECGVAFLKVSAPEVVSGMSGESEAKLRALFREAKESAPAILFIDEIDAIFPKRENAQREMERRIVAQMLTCMDELACDDDEEERERAAAAAAGDDNRDGDEEDGEAARPRCRHVIVLGATNRPDSLDSALRRAGRFDREISMGIPTEAARVKILQVMSRRLKLDGQFDLVSVARRTPGFVGADLEALTKEAAASAVSRILSQLTGGVPVGGDVTMTGTTTAALTLTVSAPIGSGARDVGLDSSGVIANSTAGQTAAERPQQQGASQVQKQREEAPAYAPADADADANACNTAGNACMFMVVGDAPVVTTTPPIMTLGRLLPGNASRRRPAPPVLPRSLLADISITMADFETALPKVQPSVTREGFATKPGVTWDDVGSLDEVREELTFAISQPIAHPERFAALGIPTSGGVLLYGPPGCGKTLVAKAAAAESGANFISIKGPELLNKYVGESERAVRSLFARARAAHPCVLFFDEMDALAPRRGTDNNQAAERLVNQLLTEMDGAEGRRGVYVVAATNRPDMIDPALLRPGRLDKILFVPLPPPAGRASILRTLTRRTPMAADVDLDVIAISPACDGFSGADMAALAREAAVLALKESVARSIKQGKGPGDVDDDAILVCDRHFRLALSRVAPSVSRKDNRAYEALRLKLRASRSHIGADGEIVSGNSGSADADADKNGAAVKDNNSNDTPASEPTLPSL